MRSHLLVSVLFLVVACGNGETKRQVSEPCTVTDNDDGSATIACPDGTEVTLDAPAAGCTLTSNGDGTSTLTCADGTSVTIPSGTSTGTGSLTGIVERYGDEAHDGTTVTLVGTNFTTITDANGRYTFTNVPSGVYVVHAESDGFFPLDNPNTPVITGTLEAPTLLLKRSLRLTVGSSLNSLYRFQSVWLIDAGRTWLLYFPEDEELVTAGPSSNTKVSPNQQIMVLEPYNDLEPTRVWDLETRTVTLVGNTSPVAVLDESVVLEGDGELLLWRPDSGVEVLAEDLQYGTPGSGQELPVAFYVNTSDELWQIDALTGELTYVTDGADLIGFERVANTPYFAARFLGETVLWDSENDTVLTTLQGEVFFPNLGYAVAMGSSPSPGSIRVYDLEAHDLDTALSGIDFDSVRLTATHIAGVDTVEKYVEVYDLAGGDVAVYGDDVEAIELTATHLFVLSGTDPWDLDAYRLSDGEHTHLSDNGALSFEVLADGQFLFVHDDILTWDGAAEEPTRHNDVSVTMFTVSNSRTHVAFIEEAPGYAQLKILDAETGDTTAVPQALTPGAGVLAFEAGDAFLVAWSFDDGWITAGVYNPSTEVFTDLGEILASSLVLRADWLAYEAQVGGFQRFYTWRADVIEDHGPLSSAPSVVDAIDYSTALLVFATGDIAYAYDVALDRKVALAADSISLPVLVPGVGLWFRRSTSTSYTLSFLPEGADDTDDIYDIDHGVSLFTVSDDDLIYAVAEDDFPEDQRNGVYWVPF